jgi:hypothetical protein
MNTLEENADMSISNLIAGQHSAMTTIVTLNRHPSLVRKLELIGELSKQISGHEEMTGKPSIESENDKGEPELHNLRIELRRAEARYFADWVGCLFNEGRQHIAYYAPGPEYDDRG